MTASFTYHSDPSHGWLKVDRSDALALGFTANDFSKYSFVADGGTLYLEEDCDAPKFLAAYQTKYGMLPTIREKHTNRQSHIRSYRRNGT